MRELAGKGKRVVGMFVLMVGAGIVLDSHVTWVGAVVMLIGAGAFAWGFIAARPRAALLRAEVASTQPTEGNA